MSLVSSKKGNLNLKNNFFGGITAAIVALPLGLAFGVASGLGPTAGIYGAIILGFLASLLGGTPTQISGPTGPMTVVIASSIVALNGDINSIVAVIFIAGAFQVIFGFLKVGKYVQYIPYPVISGFMSGIGVIIIILQLNPYFGFAGESSVVHTLMTLPQRLGQTNIEAFILASLTLGVMLLTPQRVAKVLPTPLIALLVLTPLSTFLGFEVPLIGEIPTSFPELVMPTIDIQNYSTIFTLAFTLAVLGMIDTLLTSIVADSITGEKHKPNLELFGQGVGNMVCSLFGALPGAGATMRTVVNVKSGGTNRLSGIIHALTLFLIVIFLAPYASQIPLAILAGILIKVGIDILDYRFFGVWKDSPKNDLLVMLVVFFITIFVDLITAVGVGVVLASMLIVYRVTKETNITLDSSDSEESSYDLLDKQMRVIKINGPFFFGSSTAFENNIHTILDTKTIVIDISSVPFIDITAIFTLKDLILKLEKNSIDVIIVTNEKNKKSLLKFNKKQIFDKVRFFSSMEQVVEETV